MFLSYSPELSVTSSDHVVSPFFVSMKKSVTLSYFFVVDYCIFCMLQIIASFVRCRLLHLLYIPSWTCPKAKLRPLYH